MLMYESYGLRCLHIHINVHGLMLLCLAGNKQNLGLKKEKTSDQNQITK